MREAKANDYWRKIPKVNYKRYVKNIDFHGYNGIGKIDIGCGIRILCGLNGAGKTTILSGIKAVLGAVPDEQDVVKIGDADIEACVEFDDKTYTCLNKSENTLLSQIPDFEVAYFDYFYVTKTLNFFWTQENIEEFVEQNEIRMIDEKQLEELNYLIGKQYKAISVVEFEDVMNYECLPYFIVEEVGCEYDSRKMGLGEFSLLYLWWYINRFEKNIIVLEEPESFLSIISQKHLMNILAKISVEKQTSIIISTHSPFILEKVDNEHVSVVSRAVGKISISRSNNKKPSEILGFPESKKGVFFVEDEMAKIYLEIMLHKEDKQILNNFQIIDTQGSGKITEIMKQGSLKKMDYKVIGIYDEDQTTENHDCNELEYYFLPPQKDVESDIKNLICCGNHIDTIACKLNITNDEFIQGLSEISGLDHHEWITGLCENLNFSVYHFLDIIYDIWIDDNRQRVNDFIGDLRNEIYKE